TVHGKDLTSAEAETLHDVMEAMCVDRLLERLAEKILSTLRIGHMSEDRQDDVVGDQTLSGRKEAEIAKDDSALVVRKIVAAPHCDVAPHRNFLRLPVIPVSVQVMLPGPVILQRHELIDIHHIGIDQAL